MGNLVSFLAAAVNVPGLNWVGQIVAWIYSFIGNYGWTVVLFTVFLKLLTLPLDFWQRCSAKKNAVKMEQMRPMMAKIDKAYGENKKGAQAEKQRLMKKYGYSMFSSCLPTIVTLAVFIIMFTGLTSYTNFSNAREYNELVNCYHYSVMVRAYADEDLKEFVPEDLQVTGVYEQGMWSDDADDPTSQESQYRVFFKDYLGPLDDSNDPRHDAEKYVSIVTGDEVQKLVGEYAKTNRESFLWIKNIWRPDTWDTVMPDYNTFTHGSIGMGGIEYQDQSTYDTIFEAVGKYAPGHAGNAGWNGLLLLPALAAGLSFLSAFISRKTMGAADPAMQGGGKLMMFMMPAIMVLFLLFYTAALGVYMVSSTILSIITSLVLTPIVNKIYSKKDVTVINKASYRR